MWDNIGRPRCRKNGIVVQDYQDETLVYDLESNKAFCLNETSALVWKSCDGNRSVFEITENIKQNLDGKANEALVEFALDQLSKEGLIEDYQPKSIDQHGVSRRSVLKKLGLSTAVALPMIASLIAPPAAYSQSGCVPGTMQPTGCPCTVPSNCTSNCVGGFCT